MLHFLVVFMCVNADVVKAFQCVFHDGMHYASYFAGRGDAVYRGVRLVVQPLPVIYDIVGVVFAGTKDKRCNNPAVRQNDIAVAVLYVFTQEFFIRIPVNPLVRIAAFYHELSGYIEDFLHPGQVCRFRMSYDYLVFHPTAFISYCLTTFFPAFVQPV